MPCLSPIRKENPNWKKQDVGLNYLKDCEHQYINIPCGWCASCVAVKQMYFVQRVQMEALKNHLFMLTLTYNNEWLPSIEVGDYTLRYADMKHVTDMFKRIRNKNLISRPWRYFLVSEFGKLKARPHFHALIVLPRYDSDTFNTCLNLQNELWNIFLDNWCINVGSKRVPDYKPCCTFIRKFIHGKLRSNYDLHYVNPSLTASGVCDAAFYVLKYMLKDSARAQSLQQALKLNYPPEDYEIIWNIVKPRHQCSAGFGLNAFYKDGRKLIYDNDIIDYLHDCVVNTPVGSPYPFFFSPDNGMSFPLAPYYRKIGSIFSVDNAIYLWKNKIDNFNDIDWSKVDKQIHDFNKRLDLVQSDEFDFDDFYI